MPNRPDTLPGFVLAQGQPVRVADCATEQRFVVPPATALRPASALAVPLSDRGRIVGALRVRSRTPQRFGDDELRFLESLANLLATSLQRAQTEEALNHAQRLESVGQLTGGIAHDFNNLLTVISGNLQVLEELPARRRRRASRSSWSAAASRASRRGAELTGKLLAFSRRQVLQPTALDAGTLLQSLADMLRRTLDQRIRIEVDTPRGLPAGAGRRRAARVGAAEHRDQRARRDARRRPAVRSPAARCRRARPTCPPSWPRSTDGDLRRDRRRRHRHAACPTP